MKVRIHEIQDAGTLDITATLPAKQILLDLPDHTELTDDVQAQIHAETLTDEVLLWATITAKVGLLCSRCLEKYETALTTNFEVRVPFQQAFVDISEETRQALLLAMPFQPLCRPECLGLCPQCGKNRSQGECGCSGSTSETLFSKLKNVKIK